MTSTKPGLKIVKTAVKAPAGCPGVDGVTLTVNEGEQVRYCYVVTNTGDAPLLNVKVVDDNGTPLNPADDFEVTLGGLSELGGGQGKDLAAGATATGASALKSFEPGTVLNVATATGQSSTGEQLSATDTAIVTAEDIPPTIVVTKSADPASVAEPGGSVSFPVTVKNTSFEPVTITSLTDAVDGGAAFSIATPATAPVTATTCAVGAVIAPGATYSCSFSLDVSGNAGDVVKDVVSATAVDNDGTSVTASDDAQVTVTDVPPTIEVTKDDGGVSVEAPGAPVEYTVGIKNTSFEKVTVTEITESVDGGTPFSVTAPATDPVTATTCAIGTVIEPGATYTCTFTVLVSGKGGEVVTDEVKASVVDDDETPATGTDDESTPVTPVVDLAITKSIDQSTLIVGQQGTYTLTITNKGPSDATDVVMTDTLPTGLTPVSVDGPSGWTCTVESPKITCTTATFAAGATATATIVVQVGADAGASVTNVAEVGSKEPDKNPSDNRAEVTTPVVEVQPAEQAQTTTTTAAVAVQGATLPYTGSDSLRLVGVGLVLIGGGLLLLVAVRRRRPASRGDGEQRRLAPPAGPGPGPGAGGGGGRRRVPQQR
ncbi:MAG: DUF11 domain-containing protein [Acidimicrobiales bacterium]